MREYLLVLLIAAGVTYVTASLARRVALRFNAVALVRDRDVHTTPIPYFGGAAMLAGVGWQVAVLLVVTTLVTALFYDNCVTVAHIGDSRLYRLRGQSFLAITRDHSLLQEQIDSGVISVEDARFSQNKNLVTRAVGVDPDVETEIHDYPVLPGDIYVQCSDGLNDMLEDEEIRLTLQTLAANLELAAGQLIQMANDKGGRDNVSVIVIKVLREFPAAGGWWSKFMARVK